MTTKEINSFISNAKNKDWFKSKNTQIEFNPIDQSISFEGISALNSYVINQIKGWKKELDKLDQREFQNSLRFFEDLETAISNFVENNYEAENLDPVWNSRVGNTIKSSRRDDAIPFDSPEAIFLIEIATNNNENFSGAYDYLIKNNTSSVTTKNYFIGATKAFEFEQAGAKPVAARRKAEKTSMTKIRTEFQNLLSQAQSDLTEHVAETRSVSLELGSDLMKFKDEKTEAFNNWFESAKSNFEQFDEASREKIKTLENTYREKLKLEEPAKYWSDRAKKLKRQGWFAMAVIVIIVLITTKFLGELLWETPESILLSWFNDDKSSAIRWSIIYVTLISFVAFCLRAVIRFMFSSFHLSRDNEERHTLTYFYLSLLNDSKVDKEDKRLIMQSLFSRADTGLIKEDSSPKMPSDVTKLFEK